MKQTSSWSPQAHSNQTEGHDFCPMSLSFIDIFLLRWAFYLLHWTLLCWIWWLLICCGCFICLICSSFSDKCYQSQKNTFYMVPSFAGLFLLVCMCAPEILLDVEDRTFSRFLKMYSCICVDRVCTAVTMSGKTEKLYILIPLLRERFLSSLSSWEVSAKRCFPK